MNETQTNIIGIGLSVAGLFAMNNQESKAQDPTKAVQYLENLSTKVHPNKTDLNWYGSGDVNRDESEANIINQNDANRLEDVLNGLFSDPNDRRLRDRADVNGDGNVNYSDRTILQSYINNRHNNSLPSDLSKTTRAQTLDWIQRMINIDNPKKTCPDPEPDVCDCTQFSEQMYINFHGIDKESLKEFLKIYPYDTLDNGRFNINITRWDSRYYDSSKEEIGAHNLNGFFVGDNALNFSDWAVSEPQENSLIEIGQGYLGWADSSWYDIRGLPMIEGELPWFAPLGYYIGYSIKNKVPSEGVYYHQKYPNNPAAIQIITEVDHDAPNISISKPTNGQITNNPQFVGTINDESIFDRYKMVDGQKLYYNQNNSYSIDGVKSNEQVFNYTNRSLSGLSEGQHTLEVKAIDEFDNQTTTAPINFTVDRTPPQFNSTSPIANSTYTGSTEEDKKVHFIYSVSDPHLDLLKSYYKFNEALNYLLSSTDTISLTSKEGMNKLEVYLIDKAGNATSKTVNYSYAILDAVDDKISKDKVIKAFPSPARDIISFEIGNNFGRETEVEMYDAIGRLVGKKKTNEDAFDYDVSDYDSGIYMIRILDPRGVVLFSGKIIKE